ncbi:helix-turn-helix domain-containing protein [Nocardiopsis alba]|uniref:Helix-turn-helix domain-containing protein n=2 Tax=Nocardiopsis alba TaxID=53437 RepID=A0ABV5E2H4_9ACTN|nr:helix-turn-helix domain-containing protein [Nocardiopsis alba]AFR06085.1 DNA binding, excisionase family domain protein [Nocardiopsis alba ATCC BAA-2165]
MTRQYYSVDQVAELLGLHVKTVRAYVREGRLPATRIGKQYRIHRKDLVDFTGGSPDGDEEERRTRPRAEASTVLQIDDVDDATADRLSTLVTSAGIGVSENASRVHAQVVRDPERGRVKIVLVGDLEGTARLMEYVRSLVHDDL